MLRTLAIIYFASLSVHYVQSMLIDRTQRNYKNIPDRKKNTADFVEKWGYPTEEHDVMTRDGYTLTLFRIPRSVKTQNKKERIPIYMQHGIYLNSDQWVLRGTHDLPFLLSEMGYDVWMGNSRGTRYSRHRRYTSSDYQFWNYSVDDIAANDLSVVIDYVLNTTEKTSLTYVGHSRGCSSIVMLLSSQPEYNNKIHLLQLLAPVIYSTYAPNPLYHLAGNRATTLMRITTLQNLRKSGNLGNLLGMYEPIKAIIKTICTTGTQLDRICPMFYFFINGEDFSNFNQTLMPMMLEHFSEGVSVKEIIHLLQISEYNSFQKYDYKEGGNMKRYGRTTPPVYNISVVQPPTYIYYGSNDLFLSERDLKKFIAELPNFRESFKVPFPKFNHIDYFWGMNTNKILFPKFLSDLSNFHKNRISSHSSVLNIKDRRLRLSDPLAS